MHHIHHLINTNIGKHIYQRRQYLEITLEEFSSYSGIPMNDLAQIERGAVKITILQLFKISHALNVHISQFFEIQKK